MSDRELDVVELLVQGASNREIAAGLHISPNTVKVHLRNVYTKLGVASRTECATVAVQQGLISLPGVTVDDESTQDPDEPEEAEPAAAEEEAADGDEEGEEKAVEPAGRPRWQYALFGLSLVATVVLLVVAGTRVFESASPTPTPEPNPEVQLANDWFGATVLPEPRAGMATASVGLTVYAIGGDDVSEVHNTLFTYDTNGSGWATAAPKPTAVTDVDAAVLFGEIYVPGGRMAGGAPTAAVEVYSPSNNAWRAVTDLPQPLSGAVVVTDGSFIYVFGGWNGETYVDAGYVYDPSTDGWRPLPPLPRALAFAAGGTITGSIYVAGGYDGEVDLDTCFHFDIVEESWSSCPPLLDARGSAAAVALFNRLYVLGGGIESTDLTYGEIFNPSTDTWQVINIPAEVQESAWTDLGATVVERRVYATGGREGDQVRTSNLIYVPLPFRTFIPNVSDP